MAGAGGASVETLADVPEDSQFAPLKAIDGSTPIAVADTEFTTPTTCTSSSAASGERNMTDADITTSGTAAFSGTKAQSYDQNPATFYRMDFISSTGTGIIKADFGVSALRSFTMDMDTFCGSSLIGTAYVEYSTNDSTWTEIANYPMSGGGSVVRDTVINHTFRYLRVRLVCTTGGSNGISVLLYEWSKSGIPQITVTHVAANARDDKSNPTTLRQKTNSEVAPWVKADMGSAVEMLGVAIHFHADTDITKFKIEASVADSTYYRRKTVPYTLITEGAWNIILFPRPSVQCRYLKITGLDAGAKTISVNEIAVLVLTESVINRRHRHIEYLPASDCSTLLGA